VSSTTESEAASLGMMRTSRSAAAEVPKNARALPPPAAGNDSHSVLTERNAEIWAMRDPQICTPTRSSRRKKIRHLAGGSDIMKTTHRGETPCAGTTIFAFPSTATVSKSRRRRRIPVAKRSVGDLRHFDGLAVRVLPRPRRERRLECGHIVGQG